MKRICIIVSLLTCILHCRFAVSQSQPDGSMPQFLFPEFSSGKVRLKNGNFQTLMLNYNTVSEKVVYEKDGKYYDVINSEIIDTVFINEHKFVTAGKGYYEVLLITPIPLFLQYQGQVRPPPSVAAYGGTSEVSSTTNYSSLNTSTGSYNLKLPENYTVKVDQVYWIRKDNDMFSFATERQFLKIFPDKESELKQFIKQNRIKFDKISDLISLVKYCSEISG
jgi:hypothetical protein